MALHRVIEEQSDRIGKEYKIDRCAMVDAPQLTETQPVEIDEPNQQPVNETIYAIAERIIAKKKFSLSGY